MSALSDLVAKWRGRSGWQHGIKKRPDEWLVLGDIWVKAADELEAALALQPRLTDDEIEAEVDRRCLGSLGDYDRELSSIAKWARDRIAGSQETQS